MKEYVSLTTTAMKMGIDISTVITATVVKRKKKLHWVIPRVIIQGMSPLPQAIFTSGRYHRDVKISKILGSNSKQIRFHSILKK